MMCSYFVSYDQKIEITPGSKNDSENLSGIVFLRNDGWIGACLFTVFKISFLF